MKKDEMVLSWAAALADGRDIDWSHGINSDDDELRRLTERLKLLEQIARVHREQSAEVMLGDEGLESAATIDASRRLKSTSPSTKTWGDLVLKERVGQGSYGEVYRAWDPKLERDVALKLYWPSKAGGAEPDVEREGKLLARLRHTNVITVYGADRREGRVGIWMEFLQGRSLEELLPEHGALSAAEAALVGIDVCSALAATHKANLLHGDLKAQNVMREEGGRIVVMDFSAGRDSSLESAKNQDYLSGTPLYMAPELFFGKPPSVLSDIYSVGVLLYYLVTSSYPVSGASVSDLRDAHRRGERTSLRDVRPDVPARFIDVVERAIAPDPNERFQSAGDFARVLQTSAGFVDGEEEAAVRKFPSRQVWIVAALLLIAITLSYVNLRSREPTLLTGDIASNVAPPLASPEVESSSPSEGLARDSLPARPEPEPPLADVATRDVMEATQQRANLLQTLGHFVSAKDLHEQLVEDSSRVYGGGHIEVAHNLVALASAFQGMRDYAQAERCYELALSIYEARLGAQDPAYLASVRNLNSLLSFQGKETVIGTDEVTEVSTNEESVSLTELGGGPAVVARSYSVEAALYSADKDGNRRLLSGAKVSPGDRLFLELHSSAPLYVYIVNQDELGKSYLLFPLPAHEIHNPVPSNTTVRLPGTVGGEPVFWQVTSAGGREQILIVASPRRLRELESEVLALSSSMMGRPVLAARLSTETIGRLRGIGGLVKALSDVAPAATSLFEIAGELPSHVEFVRGAWIRRLELDNPL